MAFCILGYYQELNTIFFFFLMLACSSPENKFVFFQIKNSTSRYNLLFLNHCHISTKKWDNRNLILVVLLKHP